MIYNVFTHMARSNDNLLEQKKTLAKERVQFSLDWFGTTTWPTSTNMAALSSCETYIQRNKRHN